MRKTTLLLAFTLLTVLATAQQKDAKQLSSGFDKLLSAQFKADEPGATALIAHNGQVIYKKAYGLADVELSVPMKRDNIFKIGSITKQFTAVVILQLMEQGKLSLQDEITRYIPDYPTQGNKITIEHLLTHTSGIRNYTSIKDTVGWDRRDVTPVEMIDYFKNQPMRFAPGTRWEYSNSGYFLLGYIIEKITGRTYAEYLEEHFFTPLQMNNSSYASDTRIIENRVKGYRKNEKGYENAPYLSMTQPYAAGSILSTVGDLFKWHQAIHSHKLIKKETLDKALTKYKLADGKETTYGYGWRLGNIYESPTIWHGGMVYGFITMATYLPKEDVFVAVFSNCESNNIEDVTLKLAAHAIGKPFEYKEISMAAETQQDYEGVYESGNGQLRIISVSSNKLYSQIGRGAKSPVRPFSKDKFFFEDATRTLELSRGGNGKIDKLTATSLKGNETWIKTDKPAPSTEGIKLGEKILEAYTGLYEIAPEFTVSVTRQQDKLFVQARGQEPFEILAEAENKFFTKVNDAQLEFLKDNAGIVTKAIFRQGGRQTEARKIK
jgi:CubicO group peptidase (beta-lactamase class C family)